MAYESNEWLQLNKNKIEEIKYMLTEMAYKNENPGVPIVEIKSLIIATVNEIKKCQVEIDSLKEALKTKSGKQVTEEE